MLIDKLTIEIYEHRQVSGREGDTIIMHPDTFEEIFKQIAPLYGAGKAQVPFQGVHLRGCQVFRSEDVAKNEFVIR